MKRIIFSALIVLLLLFLAPSDRSLGRQGTTAVPDLTTLKWVPVSTNAVKTDLGGDLPEVVILTLTNDQFTKINGNKDAAMKYFMSQKIFKKLLVNVVFCGVTPSDDGTGQWILIIPHTYQSTAFIVAWQVPQKYEK